MEEVKKKKLKIGIIIALCIIAVTVLIIVIANVVSNNKKLATPTNLQVVTTTTGKTYISVDKCDGAVTYKFEITNTDSKTTKNYESPTNQFDATSYFNTPANYTITCQYLGSNNAQTSDVCQKINFKATKKMATPTIKLGTGADEGKLIAETNNNFGENVPFTFTLYYTDSNQQKTSTAFTQTFNDTNGACRGYFSLSTIFSSATSGSQYYLAVKVTQTTTADEEIFYLASDMSKQLLYTIA